MTAINYGQKKIPGAVPGIIITSFIWWCYLLDNKHEQAYPQEDGYYTKYKS